MTVHNFDAYSRARSQYIIQNAQKTWNANTPDAGEILNWVHSSELDGNNFAASLSEAYSTYGKLTEKQCEAVRNCIARDLERKHQYDQKKAEWAKQEAAEKALAPEVPEGRYEITGEILFTKWYESDYGSTLKCIIRDDRGFKVFGSVPSAIVDYAYSEEVELKGQRVQLTGTVTQADDDTKFGYFKRPAKSILLEAQS